MGFYTRQVPIKQIAGSLHEKHLCLEVLLKHEAMGWVVGGGGVRLRYGEAWVAPGILKRQDRTS